MTKKQIHIRDVPEALYEWIETERHAKRVSQKEFLLKVLENAAGILRRIREQQGRRHSAG